MGIIKVTPEVQKTIIEHYKKGRSTPSIAKELNLTGKAIGYHLRKANIQIRSNSEAHKLWHRQRLEAISNLIVDLYDNQRLTLGEIGRRVHFEPYTIGKYLRSIGKIRTATESRQLRGTHLSGARHPCWKGGKGFDSSGYIFRWVPEHPRAVKGYVREHILVWEEYHQKQLPKGYCIHHLNGIKDDNRPENLVAMKAGEHIHQTEPFKKKIRQLEIENRQLRRALEDSQMIFYISEN